MRYDLNQLSDPARFQRLVNAILTARFGENARLTPLRGPDGGSDGETAPSNPHMEFQYDQKPSPTHNPLVEPPHPGRYLFQAKYHPTGEQRLSEIRKTVVKEFQDELQKNVLARPEREGINYFFVITNVPVSAQSINQVDRVRASLLETKRNLHADIWWGEKITASLDLAPDLWPAFPEIFPGGVPPLLAQSNDPQSDGIARTFRLAVLSQYHRDLAVKFRQIKLEHALLDLFVDLDIKIQIGRGLYSPQSSGRALPRYFDQHPSKTAILKDLKKSDVIYSALNIIINDHIKIPRILLEGGPGQGKSTVTQMAAQIYREAFLGRTDSSKREPIWHELSSLRFPLRLELRAFAEWQINAPEGTLEEFIANVVSRDSGGRTVTVDELQTFIERSSMILLLDGLDEIGSDVVRDRVLESVMETIHRFEDALSVDLRVVLTTRPPAIAGRRTKLSRFTQLQLQPMQPNRVDDYVSRWLTTQIKIDDERTRISDSFNERRNEPHVKALARNPMQLSVLLQFIYLKGQAFPDRRAELYREYFQTVIDRDVEKSPQLREYRDVVEGLHAFLGFRLHGATEIDDGRRTMNRDEIIQIAGEWLSKEGHANNVAAGFFALGEERFGLIVATTGEGQNTNYGFEVQPIQEYFAASYISNHLADRSPDQVFAHHVFELLIQRAYWREIILFLAGLRRPNEKADLVARAKASDIEVVEPWRRQGRSIVTELLLEGVFAQPRHVLMEAVDFVLELIDWRILASQNDPALIIDMICQVGKRFPGTIPASKIYQLAQQCSTSNDSFRLSLIHRLCAELLPFEQYRGLVIEYQGTEPEALATVRISCPYRTESIFRSLAAEPEYWRQMSVASWGRSLWHAVLRSGTVIDVIYPSQLQIGVLLEFASSAIDMHRASGRPIQIQSERPWAVWKLVRNLQIIRSIQSSGVNGSYGDGTTPLDQLSLPLEQDSDQLLCYDSLRLELAECLRNLIESSDTVLFSLLHREHGDLQAAVEHHLAVIEDHLNDGGISAWIACRCAIEFLDSVSPHLGQFVDRRFYYSLLPVINDFYGARHTPVSRRHHTHRMAADMPSLIRLRRGGSMVPLSEVLSDLIHGVEVSIDEEVLLFVSHGSLSSFVIKPLVESCRSDLQSLLRVVGERTVISFGDSPTLRVHYTRRILKICRETADQEILKGASTLLQCSRFARVAEPEIVLKILAASQSPQFAFRVLDPSWAYYDDAEGSDASQRDAEVALSVTLSKAILDEPARYPSETVSLAIAYRVETQYAQSVPLFKEHPDLVEL